MKDSSTSARHAVSGSTDFPWDWRLGDLDKRPKHGHTVFSCFSCGGGSSMGYKLAGYEVVGNCEIDPDMMKIYRKNNHPEHSFLMDIRDFVELPEEKLPEKLKCLDVLDGSPPCSVFSLAGVREEGWNVEKSFREGQAKQRLDDLFFYFIRVAERLRPKVVIAAGRICIFRSCPWRSTQSSSPLWMSGSLMGKHRPATVWRRGS